MGLYTPNMLMERVFKLGYRPAIKKKWPPGLKVLMKDCWSEEIGERPEFSQVKVALKRELALIDPDTTAFLSEQEYPSD